MTEKLLKATLNPNTHTHNTMGIGAHRIWLRIKLHQYRSYSNNTHAQEQCLWVTDWLDMTLAVDWGHKTSKQTNKQYTW